MPCIDAKALDAAKAYRNPSRAREVQIAIEIHFDPAQQSERMH